MYVSVQQCEKCVCVFTNKYTKGQVQKVLLWGGWAQRFGDRYLNADDLGCLPLKYIYKTNIHYFVHFLFIKWKPYATNPFEKLEGNSRVKGTGGGSALLSAAPQLPRLGFRWDNPGAWAYKLRQRSMLLQCSLNQSFVYPQTILPYKLLVFLIYEPGFCTVVLMPPLRQLLMCLTHSNTAMPHGCLKSLHLSPFPPLLPLHEIPIPPSEEFGPSSSPPWPPSLPCEASDTPRDAHLWGKHMFTRSMIPWDGLLEVIVLTGGTKHVTPAEAEIPQKFEHCF